jgi:cardiolipin synthase
MFSFLTPKAIILGVVYAITLFTIVRIIMDSRNAPKALGYLLLVITVPVLGAFIYFSLGVNYRKKKIYNKKLIANGDLMHRIKQRIITTTEHIMDQNKRKLEGHEDMVKLLLNESLEPLSSNRVTLLTNGEEKFPAVIDALESALHTIHIQYYIYEEDEIGNRIKNILIQKAKSGVQVRFIYDDFGSHGLSRKFFRELRDAGVELVPFFKVQLAMIASRINYRNHRKIIVIDGRIGFVGGINISDRYINHTSTNGSPEKLFWRDTHIKIEGPGVLSLQYHFLADWNFCSKQDLQPEEIYFPPAASLPKGDSLVQIVASGPDYTNPAIMLCFFTAIVNAREQVYITSPYFIPNNSINDAIKKAAFSGKDVRLLVPGVSDSHFVNAASRSYYGELLSCGVKIYLYQKGFVHAKTIVVDNNLAIVSTANMDFRSFEFNFEIGAVIYGERVCGELTQQFLHDIQYSEQLTINAWRARGKWSRLVENLARLFSPLL